MVNVDTLEHMLIVLLNTLDALKESRQEVCFLQKELGERDRRIDELSATREAKP